MCGSWCDLKRIMVAWRAIPPALAWVGIAATSARGPTAERRESVSTDARPRTHPLLTMPAPHPTRRHTRVSLELFRVSRYLCSDARYLCRPCRLPLTTSAIHYAAAMLARRRALWARPFPGGLPTRAHPKISRPASLAAIPAPGGRPRDRQLRGRSLSRRTRPSLSNSHNSVPASSTSSYCRTTLTRWGF